MIIKRTYKYRLYPNKKQRELLDLHFEGNLFAYNFVADRINGYTVKYTSKQILQNISKGLTYLKKNEPTVWLNQVNSFTLTAGLFRAYKYYLKYNKINNIPSKTSKYADFPNSRKKISFDSNRVILSKFKEGIRCKFHRPFSGKVIKTSINKTKTNKYFVLFTVQDEITLPPKNVITDDTAVGIDVGIKSFIVTSDNMNIPNPLFLTNKNKRIRRIFRQLGRINMNSKRFEKHRIKLARLYERATNCRRDFLHKITKSLSIADYNLYCVENLSIMTMINTNPKYRIIILDSAWRKFRELLDYKIKSLNKCIIKIAPNMPTSKMCNNCLWINYKLTITDRVWTCPQCGKVLDRDLNASKNIKDLGLKRIIPLGKGKFKLTRETSQGCEK